MQFFAKYSLWVVACLLGDNVAAQDLESQDVEETATEDGLGIAEFVAPLARPEGLAPPAPARNIRAPIGEDLGEVMDLMRRGQWVAAEVLAAEGHPLFSTIVNWHKQSAGLGTFGEVQSFLAAHGDWPGLGQLQAQAEIAFVEDATRDATAYFEDQTPRTWQGALALAAAHDAAGKRGAANDVLRQAVAQFTVSVEAMEEAIKQFGRYRVNPDDYVDRLLFQGDIRAAAQYFDLVSQGKKAEIDARLKAARGAENAAEALAALPDGVRASGSFAFQRFIQARQAGQFERALGILRAASASAARLGRPEAWASGRVAYAREVLRRGDIEGAYKLAAGHYLEESNRYYPTLEFLAGYIALEWQNDAEKARPHFAAFEAAATAPAAKARAGYWLGRAGEPEGYTRAAQYQTTFYGQLSAEMSDVAFDPALYAYEAADWRDAALLQNPVVHAGLLFYAAGEDALARRFWGHAAETLNDAHVVALAQFALDLGEVEMALYVGKSALRMGREVPPALYPIMADLSENDRIPPALALAIARQESEFRAAVSSPVGARGLMQIMPATGAVLHDDLYPGTPYDDDRLFEAEYNAELGSYYLADMLDRFGGRLPLAVAGYNAGPLRSDEWMTRFGDPRNGLEDAIRYVEMIPFDETRNYVMRVFEGLFIYQARLDEGVNTLPSDLLVESYPD